MGIAALSPSYVKNFLLGLLYWAALLMIAPVTFIQRNIL